MSKQKKDHTNNMIDTNEENSKGAIRQSNMSVDAKEIEASEKLSNSAKVMEETTSEEVGTSGESLEATASTSEEIGTSGETLEATGLEQDKTVLMLEEAEIRKIFDQTKGLYNDVSKLELAITAWLPIMPIGAFRIGKRKFDNPERVSFILTNGQAIGPYRL